MPTAPTRNVAKKALANDRATFLTNVAENTIFTDFHPLFGSTQIKTVESNKIFAIYTFNYSKYSIFTRKWQENDIQLKLFCNF